VPKLIINDSTIQMLMEKIPGFPIHAGPGSYLLEPGVCDLVDGNEKSNPWQPGDRRTRLLVLAGEACRQISFELERFHEVHARKRILKNLSIPICSLMDVVVELQKFLNDESCGEIRRFWPISDQESFAQLGRRIRKVHQQGQVRTLRHKIAAHLDTEAFDLGDLNPSPKILLEALGDTLIVLMLSFNHKAYAFSWIRPVVSLDEGQKLLVDTMFDCPFAVRWVTDVEGNVLDVAQISLAADPCKPVQESVLGALHGYNFLVQQTGAELPEMYIRPTADVLVDEGSAGKELIGSLTRHSVPDNR
jgi:hypothetical protein